jgi:hypothetical protein
LFSLNMYSFESTLNLLKLLHEFASNAAGS